ncbi:MAG: sigma-54-dependent Fis family transcriptional regulator [Gemmataceae bacterium]|nr:sigma-54-dependent Fis family transcriptional regulator [Gemmataceae bacterium]
MKQKDEQPDPRPGEGIKVLIIDDEKSHSEALSESLERVGFECHTANSGKEGARRIENEDFDVVLTDLRMADLDGLAILRKAREVSPETEVVVITGHADVKTAVEAIKQGAANYLTKPVDISELRAIVARSSERLKLARLNRDLKSQLNEKFGFEGVLGNSPKMHELVSRLKSIASTSATVLIQGETGTGKELVAKAIHNNSNRKNKPFVAMNCTALNENLLDDELFGHDAGAFTGGDKLRKGRFEYANGGTLFLDEVGDMPLPLQAKLLRVLENGEVVRIGSNEPIKVNVRVVSATHRDLESAVTAGTFRHDLYFRLNKLRIRIPPLRERKEDIPLLCASFLKEFNELHGKKVTAICEPVRRSMVAYDWPGNVRELRNLVESMVVLDQDGILNQDDLQEGELADGFQLKDSTKPGDNLLGRPLMEVERHFIEQALVLTKGNREEAAKMLGIGERTLYRVIQDWKMQDRIKKALEQNNNDISLAAESLQMSADSLKKKLKKLPGSSAEGLEPEGLDTQEFNGA